LISQRQRKSRGDQLEVIPDLFGQYEPKYAESTPLHYFFVDTPKTKLIVKPTGLTLCRVNERKLQVMSGNEQNVFHRGYPVQSLKEMEDLRIKAPKPKNNDAGREKSFKTVKRIKNSIGTVVLMATEKKAKSLKFKNIDFTFRVNFITLTLPVLQRHKDETIKSECLNQFLTEIRQNGTKNFVWVAESQENGNIHFHIATDSYIDRLEVRKRWNRIIQKLGYIQAFQEKFSKMSFEDYLLYCGNSHKEALKTRYNKAKQNGRIKNLTFENYLKQFKALADIDTLKKRYFKGVSEGWNNPNTTDIHAVFKLRNVASYMSKYMTKNPDEVTFYSEMNLTREQRSSIVFSLKARKIGGRVWGRSQSISGISKDVGQYEVSETGALNWNKANQIFQAVAERFPDKTFVNDYSMHVAANVIDLEPIVKNIFTDIRKQILKGGYLSGVSPN